MARSRNIKPSIMDNEDLAALDPLSRLLFIYLWMLADREGRLEDRPKRIATQAIAYDRTADVDSILNELQDCGLIKRYKIAGKSCIQILNFTKHQSPHGTEKDSELPRTDGLIVRNVRRPNGFITGEFSLDNSFLTMQEPLNTGATTVNAPLNTGATTVNAPLLNALIPDSGSLNPDSGFLNPDPRILIPDSGYLIPETLINTVSEAPHEGATSTVVEVVEQKASKPRKPAKVSPPTANTWNAYSAAYRQRYSVDPVRNATINGQLTQFVSRLGAEDAPEVAAWFLGHRHQFYVNTGHSVGILLRDCEKLRTEWVTGRATTMTQAIQQDKTQTNFSIFDKLRQEAAIERERVNAN